ncbi:hypothetical protein [Desulfosporosinus fructosivorans]
MLDASDGNLDYAPVRNLTYSQAVILLGVGQLRPMNPEKK